MRLEGTSRRLPIYLVLDVSGSMHGAPIEAVNSGLKDFESAVKGDPHALESAYISIITFDSTARRISALTEAGIFSAPLLQTGGATALGAALRELGQCIDADVREKDANHPGDWKPLVFLMTDGEPTDDWRVGLEEYKARKGRRPSNLIAIGCGTGVNVTVLKEVTGTVMLMPDLSAEKIKALFKWISQSTKMASRTASQQAATASGAGTGPTAQLPPPPPGFVIGL